MKKLTKDHEWIVVEGDVGTVGITDHAQDALGDIVFVELPSVGASFKQGESAAVVESVKAAGDVKSPVSGEVIEVNEALSDDSGLVNSDPEGAAWIYKIRITNPAELDGLMDEAAYQAYLAE